MTNILTLKRVLLADAVTCAVVFVLGVIDTALVAPILGLPEAVVAIAGWICLPVALLLALLALQAQPSRLRLAAVVYGNWGWVAASLAVVAAFSAQMTGIGIAVTIAQALGVAVFAMLEGRGLRAPATA